MIDGLTALFGSDSRIGAGSVDKRDDRQMEFLSQPHLHERLAIAFGMRAAEIAFLALGEVFPFLMADEHHLDVVQMREAGDDRLVVAQGAVAVQLEELVEDQLDVVAGLRPLLVPRDLHDLPRFEMRVDFPLERGQLAPQPADLFGDLGRIAGSTVLGVLGFHLRKACFHLVDGCLERQTGFSRISGRRGILGHCLGFLIRRVSCER